MSKRRKPISFNTTLRNPTRIPGFVSILSNYENMILDDEVCLKIEADLINSRLFEPTRSTLGTYVPEYHDKFEFYAEDQTRDAHEKVRQYFSEWENSLPFEFDQQKIIYLLKNTITKHNEKGFNGGWESRLYTQYVFMNELGLIKFVKGEKILISENGHLMIKNYKDGYPLEEDYDESYELSAYLTAFARYSTINPYRFNTIRINFFPLVLNTILYLDEKHGKKGISIQDIPFIIGWRDNNYKELAEYIVKFRKDFGYNTSDDLVYDYVLNLFDDSTSDLYKPVRPEFKKIKISDYKFDKIMHETPDEIIRKLRMTMLISLRGIGNFIDINRQEIEKVKHIINEYSDKVYSDDRDEFFNSVGQLDKKLQFKLDEKDSDELLDVKNKTISEWAKEKTWEYLRGEMKNLSSKRESKDGILRLINAPVRLEFLCSIIIKKAIPEVRIVANYKTDDQGIPFNAASGGNSNKVGADIDIFFKKIHAICEPTMATNRSFQVEHELPSIRNHLLNTNSYDRNNGMDIDEWFAIFVAPVITRDVGNQIPVIKSINKAEIYAWEIDDFVKFSEKVNDIRDYKIIRPYATPQEMQ